MASSLGGPVPSLDTCGPLTSMSLTSWCLGGESLWSLDLAGLWVDGLELPESDPLTMQATWCWRRRHFVVDILE